MEIDNGNVKVPTGYLINLSRLILKSKYFEFTGRFTSKNCMGTAIGTKFAPAFANLFMANLAKCFLETCVFDYGFWCRFWDNVFMVWLRGKEKLVNLLGALNT